MDAAHAGGHAVAVGVHGHVLKFAPGGDWEQAREVPVNILLTAVEFVDARTGWAVGHDAAILHTRDGGDTWQLQNWQPGLDQPLFDVHFLDAETGFAVGSYGMLYRTQDAGARWELIDDYVDFPDSHLNGAVSFDDGTVLLVGERGAAFRSPDAGDTWEQLDFPYEGSMFGAVKTTTGRVVAYGLRGRMYASNDRGDSWNAVLSGTEQSLMGGRVLADGRIALAGGNGVVLVSRDDGYTFERYDHPDGDTLAGVFELDDRLVVIGEAGLVGFDAAPDARE